MDMKSCNLVKFLVVPTFVARRLQVRQDARVPSGESWNYLYRRPSCNFAEINSSTPFTELFLVKTFDNWATTTIRLCVFKDLIPIKDIQPSDYMCCISFRNMNYAN